MSRRLDWERDAKSRRVYSQARSSSTPPDELIPILEEAVSAKLANRFVEIPRTLTDVQKSTVWFFVFQKIKAIRRAEALERATITQCQPGPRPPERPLRQNRAHQGEERRPQRGKRH